MNNFRFFSLFISFSSKIVSCFKYSEMYPPAHRLLGITQPAFSTESLFTILRSRWDEWLQKALNSGGKMKKTLKGSQTAFFPLLVDTNQK